MGIAIAQPTRPNSSDKNIADFWSGCNVHGPVPDLDHDKGWFGGRVYPLWNDSQATASNVKPSLTQFLATAYGIDVLPATLWPT